MCIFDSFGGGRYGPSEVLRRQSVTLGHSDRQSNCRFFKLCVPIAHFVYKKSGDIWSCSYLVLTESLHLLCYGFLGRCDKQTSKQEHTTIPNVFRSRKSLFIVCVVTVSVDGL